MKAVLEKKHHLSYPFVFEHEGEYYMIPETAENQTIELYKSESFPFNWQWQMNLMENVTAVDATLYFHSNKWWMFVNLTENEGASSRDELFIFYSEELHSNNWQPHKKNPVVSNVKNARPAGAVFSINNKIYRPAQNSSHRYGYGLNLNHIERLNEYQYQEKTITQIEPSWEKGLLACHSFSKVNQLYVIDCLSNSLKPHLTHSFTQRNNNAIRPTKSKQ